MAKEAAAAGATASQAATASAASTAATAPVVHTRHGSYGHPRHATRRRGHSQTMLGATDAHEHHLRRARALLDEMAGLGRRGRLQSSPAMLAATATRRVVGHRPSMSPRTSSSSVAEIRSPVTVDLDVDAIHVDTSDKGDDDKACDDRKVPSAKSEQTTESVVMALALLQQAQEAIGDDGKVTLHKDAVAQILSGLISALKMAAASPPADASTTASTATTTNPREVVERQMQRLFVSHANVFDEKVQNFIIQNFIQETDYAKAFRSAMRRTSLVKRCLKAMYPTEKQATGTPPATATTGSHWHGSLAQRAMATAHAQHEGVILEACPDVKDPAIVHTVKQLLTKVSDWDFDIFSLVKAMPGQTLLLLGNELLDKYELASHFHTTKAKQIEFLRQVQAKYLPNPYHNGEHAADVAQALHHFLAVGKVGETVNARSKCAALVAALVHDVGHTSFTNNFHIAANDDLAVKYVYRSPLEHMHCALAFQLMKAPKANVLDGLTRIEQMEVRALITDMVLATDNSVHAAYLAKLEGLLCRATTDATTWTLSAHPDDERLVLQMALHAADVSNPAKSQEQCRVWAKRILVEFYQQGDKERELELPLSIGYDRENPIPLEKMQAGFILGIVRPLFTVFCRLPGTQLGHCLTQLDENLAYWQSEISRTQT